MFFFLIYLFTYFYMFFFLQHLWCDSATLIFCFYDNNNKKAQLTHGLRAIARRHSKMALSRHLGYYRTANSAIRSADPENPNLEPSMEWIGCSVFEIFIFKLHCDLETRVRGHSRSSKVALFDRAHTTSYWSSIVTMLPRYSRILVENC